MNKEKYKLKFSILDDFCELLTECEMLDGNKANITIIDGNSEVNLNMLMRWIRAYSEGLTTRKEFPFFYKMDVILTNINSDEDTILYNTIIETVEYNDESETITIIKLGLLYDAIGDKKIEPINNTSKTIKN